MSNTTIVSIPDSVTNAGDSFSYNVWDEQTVLTLCNVPWNSDYRDVFRFPDQGALDDYIDQLPNLPLADLSYLPFQRTVMIETPINAVFPYNYVRATNALAPVAGDRKRSYYYFITAIDYVAPESTALTLQLDVWQTFGYGVQITRGYIERGHIGIANENAMMQQGRAFLTIPEGLDTGSDYRTVHITSRKIMDHPSMGDGYSIMIVSTVDITQSTDNYGTRDDPQIVAARGSEFMGIPSGADIYIFKTADDFLAWILAMQEYAWVIQGIVSITLIPDVTRYFNGVNTSLTPANPAGVPPFYKPWSGLPGRVDTPLSRNWRDGAFIGNILGDRYAGLKKFLTYPYMVLELTTWNGSPLIIKPEMWQDADATVGELASFFPSASRVAIFPRGYNADAETGLTSPNADPGIGNDDHGEFLDMAAILDNFPTIPIVSNNAGLWMAQNRHSIAFQFQNARWDQNRALAGAQAGADVASAGIRNMSRQSGIGNTFETGTTANNVNTNMNVTALGAAGGMMSGSAEGSAGLISGAMQGALGMVSAGMQGSNALANLGLSQQARSEGAISNIQQSAQARDTNLDFARYAAQGDYAMQVLGIQSRAQDSTMAQPSASGQYGGDAFNLINHYIGFSLRWKMLNLETMRAIGDVWLRYGYAVHQFAEIPADYRCMSKFTYWKMRETYLSHAMIPENFKQTIRGIFEKGVTVWSGDPSDIGNTDWADNAPLEGISL